MLNISYSLVDALEKSKMVQCNEQQVPLLYFICMDIHVFHLQLDNFLPFFSKYFDYNRIDLYLSLKQKSFFSKLNKTMFELIV